MLWYNTTMPTLNINLADLDSLCVFASVRMLKDGVTRHEQYIPDDELENGVPKGKAVKVTLEIIDCENIPKE